MGTEIQCDIDQCKYCFDGWCTCGEIIITIHDGQPVCATFCNESSNKEIQTDPLAECPECKKRLREKVDDNYYRAFWGR